MGHTKDIIKKGKLKMTPQQEKHLRSIKRDFSNLVDSKYRKGQEEHGGNLFEMPLLDLVDNSINEAIDQVVYLLTLRNRILCLRVKDERLKS